MDSDTNMVDISGLDKAEVLRVLHAGSHAQGMSMLHDHGPISLERAQELLGTGDDIQNKLDATGVIHNLPKLYFDYVDGRVMKVDLSEDTFDPWDYDRDNYEGAAKDVVSKLRAG